MTSQLSSTLLRRFATLVLALCVMVTAAYVSHGAHGSSRESVGGRGSLAPLAGVLLHAGTRGGVRTAALGHGTAGVVVATEREAESLRTLRGVRARGTADREGGEVSLDRERRRRARPADAAPHRSRVSSAATPRAPPRV